MAIDAWVLGMITKGLFSLVAFIAAIVIKKFVADKAIYSFAKRTHPENYRTVSIPISQFFAVIIYIILFFSLLYIWEIGGTLYSLLAGAGLAGIVLGFAAQDVLKNIIAGIVLFFDRPFKIGEYIQVGGVIGEVRRMGLRSTKVKNLEGVYVNIPNSKLNEDFIYNYKRYDKRRLDFVLGVDYSTDLDKAEKAILTALKGLQKKEIILSEEKVIVFPEAFDSSAINFRVIYWVNLSKQPLIFRVKGDVIKAIYKEFKKQKIIIPFQQVVVSQRK